MDDDGRSPSQLFLSLQRLQRVTEDSELEDYDHEAAGERIAFMLEGLKPGSQTLAQLVSVFFIFSALFWSSIKKCFATLCQNIGAILVRLVLCWGVLCCFRTVAGNECSPNQMLAGI